MDQETDNTLDPKELRKQRAAARRPQIPRDRLWTLVLMKYNSLFLIMTGMFITMFVLKGAWFFLDQSPTALFLYLESGILLLPMIIVAAGVLQFRCSKMGIILSCVIAILYLVGIFFILTDWITFAKKRPYDAVFPTEEVAVLGFIVSIEFAAAYLTARSWRFLKWF